MDFSGGGWLGWYFAQSIWLFSRSWRSMRVTGGCWPTSASSAFPLQLEVVQTMMRWVNGCWPEAVKKLSMSFFWTRYSSA